MPGCIAGSARQRRTLSALSFLILAVSPAWAEDSFLVTYSHEMGETGNLEVATKSVTASPANGNRFLGAATEFEYGITGRWTTSAYLDGQATGGQSALFTGYRWENRFQLLRHEHWINPVLYVEFEDIDAADKALLEVVGRDDNSDLLMPNSAGHRLKKREIEDRLILGSHFKGWTIAENFIAEKDLAHAPFEFGYAVGVSRALAVAADPGHCAFCAQNLNMGVEMYGGLGTHNDFGFRGTSQYVAPTVAWTFASDTTLRVSPGFGVAGRSTAFLLRFGLSYEIDEFGRAVRSLFHK